jgi:hypothetical protein
MRSFAIAIRDTHFLYLPVLFAEEHSFFGLLPDDCTISFQRVRPMNDEEVYRRVTVDEGNDGPAGLFGLCDPTELYLDKAVQRSRPCVLASIVTNAAFWAVDRGNGTSEVLGDLRSYDTILSYASGSTAYSMAEQICRATGREPDKCIREVADTLTELPRTARGSAIALSPELLEIEVMTSRPGGFVIELSLARTAEYTGALVTTLISRQDVVLNHPDVVTPLLRAIYRALKMTQRQDAVVEDFVVKRFGHSAAIVKRAIEKANKSAVFPASLIVNEGEWRRALEARKSPITDLAKEETQRLAATYFAAYCAPFAKWAVTAEREENDPEVTAARVARGSGADLLKGQHAATVHSLRVGCALVSAAAWIAYFIKFVVLDRRMGLAVLGVAALLPVLAFQFGPNPNLRNRAWMQIAMLFLFLALLGVPFYTPESEWSATIASILGAVVTYATDKLFSRRDGK